MSVASLEVVNLTGQPFKEAYAIYMSIRRLVFYIADADVTIKCDHLPLKKFLTKQTMNAKVNNWAVELEQFNLKMQWIMGSKNTLADSLSRLLEVCPEAAKQSEPAGQEFGCVCFDELVSGLNRIDFPTSRKVDAVDPFG